MGLFQNHAIPRNLSFHANLFIFRRRVSASSRCQSWRRTCSCIRATSTRGFRNLAEGEALEFRLITDERSGKPKAVDVTGSNGAYVRGTPPQQRYDDYNDG